MVCVKQTMVYPPQNNNSKYHNKATAEMNLSLDQLSVTHEQRPNQRDLRFRSITPTHSWWHLYCIEHNYFLYLYIHRLLLRATDSQSLSSRLGHRIAFVKRGNRPIASAFRNDLVYSSNNTWLAAFICANTFFLCLCTIDKCKSTFVGSSVR